MKLIPRLLYCSGISALTIYLFMTIFSFNLSFDSAINKDTEDMTVIYQLTASESSSSIEEIMVDSDWDIVPETETHYATLIKYNGTLPSYVSLPNSGTVDGEEFVGGLWPQRPK